MHAFHARIKQRRGSQIATCATARREEALEAAAEAVRDARTSDRDAILEAQELAAAHADRRWMAEARPLLDRVFGRLDGEEEVLDIAAGIAAGHDGVMLVTNRRVLFVAPRRTP